MNETEPSPSKAGSLADKINHLFETMHPRNRGEYTLQEVVDGIRARGGPTISITYLWQLRKGVKDNPTKQHLEAIADFFGVNPEYFFNPEAAERIESQLELLRAMRDAEIRDIALSVSELTPAGRRAIAAMIEQVRQLQGGAPRATQGEGDGSERRRAGQQDEQLEGATDDA